MNAPDYNTLNGGNVKESSIAIHYPQFHEYINDTYSPELSWKERLYWYYKSLSSRPVCPVCGQPTQFVNIKEGYRLYCSRACMNRDPQKREQVKRTNMERYGGVAPACSIIVQDKMRNTTLKRFGVENAMKDPGVAWRSHQTNMDLYGGCGNASNELKEKQKQTVLDMFGVENYMQSESFYDAVAKRHPDIISIDMVGKQYICKCPYGDCELCDDKRYAIGISQYHNRKDMTGIYKCTIANPVKDDTTKNTGIEMFVRSILDRYNIPYETNTRSIIPPQELDIYIPSYHMAIECNGIYYHNSEQKSHKYHLNKHRLCEEQGIQLLSLWEDWIYKKPSIIENILLSKLGIYKERIYARRCTIKTTDTRDANLFLNTYHIQGGCPAHIKYGLYDGDRLVCLMTFANHRNNIIGVSGWELVRFCSAAGVQVIGGAQKLLSYFIHTYHPDTLVSFSMNDISNGNLYKRLGFEKSSINQSYWYVEKDTLKRYHRSSFTKDSIIRKGWKQDKNGWREVDVVLEHGYYQIYDSGQTKWTLVLH